MAINVSTEMSNVPIVTVMYSRFSPVGEIKTWNVLRADSGGASCNHPNEERWGP